MSSSAGCPFVRRGLCPLLVDRSPAGATAQMRSVLSCDALASSSLPPAPRDGLPTTSLMRRTRASSTAHTWQVFQPPGHILSDMRNMQATLHRLPTSKEHHIKRT